MDSTMRRIGGGPPRRQIAGLVFGRLTAIEDVGANKKRNRLWRCACSCGAEVVTSVHGLLSGKTTSCGCFQRDAASQRHRTHGYATGANKTPIYRCWVRMIRRCTIPTDKSWKWYGAHGIAVCDRWLHSFENFLADMGEKPSRDHSIDRIDVNGNYEPGNCRWATWSEQRRNQRPRKLRAA